MKQTVLLAITLLCALSCCPSKGNDVKSLIQERVRKSLPQPSGYLAMETVVDSAFAPFDDPVFFEKTLEICKKFVSESNDSLVEEINKIGQEMMPLIGTEYRFIGFKVTHRFCTVDDDCLIRNRVFIMDERKTKILAEYNADSLDFIMVQAMYKMWEIEALKIQQ